MEFSLRAQRRRTVNVAVTLPALRSRHHSLPRTPSTFSAAFTTCTLGETMHETNFFLPRGQSVSKEGLAGPWEETGSSPASLLTWTPQGVLQIPEAE